MLQSTCRAGSSEDDNEQHCMRDQINASVGHLSVSLDTSFDYCKSSVLRLVPVRK